MPQAVRYVIMLSKTPSQIISLEVLALGIHRSSYHQKVMCLHSSLALSTLSREKCHTNLFCHPAHQCMYHCTQLCVQALLSYGVVTFVSG